MYVVGALLAAARDQRLGATRARAGETTTRVRRASPLAAAVYERFILASCPFNGDCSYLWQCQFAGIQDSGN
jgi:hypothetical protein